MTGDVSDLWKNPEVRVIGQTIRDHTTTKFEAGLWDILPLTGKWIFDTDIQSALDISIVENVEAVVEHLDSARAAYRNLHPTVLRALEFGFSTANSDNRDIVFLTADDEAYKSFDQIGTLLDYLCAGLEKGETGSAIDDAKRIARDMPAISGKAREHGTWAKPKLVENARKLWPSMTGRPAPSAPSSGAKFFDLLAT